MSEYQYYEFRAIDRPLTDSQMRELRRYSSRAEITSTTFSVEYNWGDFKGQPGRWMETYFDAFVHVANWGTRWLMFRVPMQVLDTDLLSEYCADECVSFRTKEDKLVLSFRIDEEPDGVHGDDWLSSLIPLRADLMRGDCRCLYLAWLSSIQGMDFENDILEPPVPAGLGDLTDSLERLAEFLCIDPDLIAAAAERGKDPQHLTVTNEEIATQARVQDEPRRTVGQILARAEEIEKTRRRLKTEQAAREKTKRLESINGKEAELWSEVRQLVGSKQLNQYDKAVSILRDLRELAEVKSANSAFAIQLGNLCREHAHKQAFLNRVHKAKLRGAAAAADR